MANMFSSTKEMPDAVSRQHPLTGPDTNKRDARAALVRSDHQADPVAIRRRLSFSGEHLPVALQRLRDCGGNRVDLSTRNRDVAPPGVDLRVAVFENVRTSDIEQMGESAVYSLDQVGTGSAKVAAGKVRARFNTRLTHLNAVPPLGKLQQRAERTRQQGLEKPLIKLTGMTAGRLAAIDALTRSIDENPIHEPRKELNEPANRCEPWDGSPFKTRGLSPGENMDLAVAFSTAGEIDPPPLGGGRCERGGPGPVAGPVEIDKSGVAKQRRAPRRAKQGLTKYEVIRPW